MPVSTPLDKIDSHDDQPSDEERVKRIIQEMNKTDDSPGENQAPPQYNQGSPPQYQQGPPPPQYQQGAPQYQQAQFHKPPSYQQGPPQYEQEQEQQPQIVVKEEPIVPVKKNIWAHITDLLKLPFVVAVVFFLFSLPVVDVYIAKYASWAFSSGGTLTMAGLAVKALSAGAVMGVYDTMDKAISRLF